jgi:iron(II)-dependent oxidoreductase
VLAGDNRGRPRPGEAHTLGKQGGDEGRAILCAHDSVGRQIRQLAEQRLGVGVRHVEVGPRKADSIMGSESPGLGEVYVTLLRADDENALHGCIFTDGDRRLPDSMPGTAQVTGDVKERIAAELEAARVRTLSLLAPFTDEELTAQVSPLMSPLVWDLAHIGHFEELWISRQLRGAAPIHPESDDTYDAFAHVREERPSLSLLDPVKARAYLADVRARSLDVLEDIDLDPSDPLLRGGFAFGLVVQHEQQHVETMLQTIQLSGLEHEGGRPPVTTGQRHEVRVEAGTFAMGTDDEPWAYDNERPSHEVDVPAFSIDAEPVTNGAYAEFLAVTGTTEPPLSWERDAGAWVRRHFGRLEPVPPDEPVQHVSWEEADAYARWAGKRLPTEAEWERAAKLGVLRGVGSVWEWTSSDFGGYPGFSAFPYAEYSQVFFGHDYKVLRGASWATSGAVSRLTFRNWDFPIRRQIFSGFRCARDA